MKSLFLFFLFPAALSAQYVDTLSFQSATFDQERSIYVHLNPNHKYLSSEVKIPVIYILDGQHEWFVNPILNDIEYLKYTHEIPNAIVVVIPHKDRYVECGIDSLDQPLLPLHRFITEEIEERIAPYYPGEYRMIIGHSFSASFSLYSALMGEGFYSAVLAHSPLDKLEPLIQALEDSPNIEPEDIAISIGGIDADKDKYHRLVYEEVKAKHPTFFESIQTYEANTSAHTGVPILATPPFLTKFFYPFSRRFGTIAMVDMEYKLTDTPGSPDEEMKKIKAASKLGETVYPPEIAEINGLAGRYSFSGYDKHELAVYEEGIKHHPAYFDFHLSLYTLCEKENPEKAKMHLTKALTLLERFERDEPYFQEIIKEIKAEQIKTEGNN